MITPETHYVLRCDFGGGCDATYDGGSPPDDEPIARRRIGVRERAVEAGWHCDVDVTLAVVDFCPEHAFLDDGDEDR